MPVINTQDRKGGSTSDFVLLPSDVYRMKVTKAVVEENRFAEPNKDGTKPQQLVLTWEITTLTEEQQDAATEAGQDWNTAAVWQRLNPYYGPVRDGGVSKFKAFIDSLRDQGYLEGFDPQAFDIDDLLGIEQRVNVEMYLKSQGENAGKPGNKVVSILPLKRGKTNGKTPAKNQPVAVGAEEDNSDLPF
jgi:hypothetical protein